MNEQWDGLRRYCEAHFAHFAHARSEQKQIETPRDLRASQLDYKALRDGVEKQFGGK